MASAPNYQLSCSASICVAWVSALGAYPNPDPWLGVFPIERERLVFQVLFAQELRIDIDLE
jgi:hypothetical protein